MPARSGSTVIQTDDASAQPPSADAGVVVAFGQLIRDPLLHAYPLYNLHPSLLPRWRGAAPIERAIMAGDEQTGVCVIELVEALDAGPVHATELIPVSRDDDAGTVSAAALELGVPLLAAALRGETTGTPQTPAGVTYARKLSADDRRLDWSLPAIELARTVRALSPHIGARTRIDGSPVTVWRGGVVEGDGGEPGAILPPLTVSCGDDAYEILELQPAGKRRMTAADYLNGLRETPRTAQ